MVVYDLLHIIPGVCVSPGGLKPPRAPVGKGSYQSSVVGKSNARSQEPKKQDSP